MGAIPRQQLVTTDALNFMRAIRAYVQVFLDHHDMRTRSKPTTNYNYCALLIAEMAQQLGQTIKSGDIKDIRIQLSEEHNHIEFTHYQNNNPECKYRLSLQKTP